jgi:hypothetical protein
MVRSGSKTGRVRRKRACLLLPSKMDMCGALAHVRFGSLADILRRERDVRFTPESRRSARPFRRED